jgi:hypothetical protein
VTIYALDLDWDLVNHLKDSHSVAYLRSEYVQPELIEDPQLRAVFEWQMAHLRKHGKPATASVLEDEFDYISLEAPQTAVGKTSFDGWHRPPQPTPRTSEPT